MCVCIYPDQSTLLMMLFVLIFRGFIELSRQKLQDPQTTIYRAEKRCLLARFRWRQP